MAGLPPIQPDPSGYSNYPRNPYGGYDPGYNPNQRPPGIYFDFIGVAWKLVQTSLGTWVASVLLFFVGVYAISIPSSFLINLLLYGSWAGSPKFETGPFIVSMLLNMIPGMLVQALNGSLLYMGLKQARGQVVEISDLTFGFRRFGSLAIAGLITTVCMYLGLILLLIPGLLVMGMLAFMPLLILDRNMTVQEAFLECVNNIGTKGFSIFALMFVVGLLTALGACLCGVGVLFTFPIYLVTIGLTYNTFYPPLQTGSPQMQIGMEPPR